jgi:hypothetical protein
MRELNGGGSEPPQWWLDTQKFATDGLSYGLVRVVREVSDPRELSAYKADAFRSAATAIQRNSRRCLQRDGRSPSPLLSTSSACA